jgi:hypothetical protein
MGLSLEMKSVLRSIKEVTSRSALSCGLLSAYVPLRYYWWAHIEMRARRDAASCSVERMPRPDLPSLTKFENGSALLTIVEVLG